MAGDWDFDMLDYPKESWRTDYKDYFRVYVAPGILKALGLEKGDPCNLNLAGNPVGTVFVWEHNKSSKPRELQISKRIRSLYGVDHGAKLSLSKIHDHIPITTNITLHEVAPNDSKAVFSRLRDEDFIHWAWILEYDLYRAENIAPGMVIRGMEVKGEKRSFEILQVNDSSKCSPYRFQKPCKVEIVGDEALCSIVAPGNHETHLNIATNGIGGFESQLNKLNKLISRFESTENGLRKPSSLPEWKNGVIIHGPPGCGKTLLLQKIGEAGWRRVFDLRAMLSRYPSASGKALTAMSDMFADAKKYQPSIILLDKLDTFAANETTHSPVQDTTFIDVLCQEVERLSSFRSLVVATTRSMAKVSPDLRSVHAFSVEIEIPVPDSRSRASILKILSCLPLDTTQPVLEKIASQTHGFVGGDLAMLLDVAIEEASDRINAIEKAKKADFSIGQIKEQDFDLALREVKPTAIREVFVEIPETKWDDIGGQEEVKKVLQKALIWPSIFSEDFEAQAIKPAKGLLLYGPPGCSKTMIARATATESHYRCIAVKGAELLNMYVGESERLIREMFSRARAVKPSILFFDEIDAIGTSRKGSQHSGLNIVTTLLNEMDGIDTLPDVFVLAATNRPDVIDPALTRAGRLDKMLYVGPPDLDARRSILSKRLQKMMVQEDLEVELLAKETDGFSGAELIKICNDAGLAAIEEFRFRCQDSSQKSSIVSRRHFAIALSGVEKAIDSEMLEFFEEFRMKHRDQDVTKRDERVSQ